ncbi:hypothetical protein QQ054_36630 [Oscillatoria amoena NRMC-F 0135]|nr:hypothetical protein [Oscillatoria amoena NRMC-F 0135]
MKNLYFLILFFFCSASALLAQPTFLVLNEKDACAGSNNGSFVIRVTSATGTPTIFVFGPPNFSRSTTVGTDELFNNLPPQNYFVFVQDGAGTSAPAVVSITNVSPGLSLSLDGSVVPNPKNNTSCITPNGTIDINVSGGTGSYSFNWTASNGYSNIVDEDISGLVGGIYKVVVIDNNANCIDSLQNLTITDPSPIIQNVTTPSPQIVCPGDDATISLANSELFVAGVSEIQYEIQVNGTPSGFVFNGTGGPMVMSLPSGNFSDGDVLTILARNSLCTPVLMNGSVTVNIQTLSVSSVITPNSRCLAPFNGAIDLTVTGAIGALSFSWAGPGGPYATEDLAAIEHGGYTVTATDLTTGCQIISVINVPDARPTLSLSSAVTPNSRCVAPFNGAINLTVAGSAGPFTFAWTGPGGPYATEDLVNIQDGAYSVTVTDGPSGCTAIANINVAPT